MLLLYTYSFRSHFRSHFSVVEMYSLQIGHGRRRRRSWRHVNQLPLKRRVWHGRVVLAVCRLCHGPVHGVLGSGLRFDVPGEELAFGVELGGVSDGSFELVVAVCSQATPSCRPRQVLLAEVRDCPSLHGLSTLSRAAASCRIVVVVAQPFSEVT